jgi:hypothetical protein
MLSLPIPFSSVIGVFVSTLSITIGLGTLKYKSLIVSCLHFLHITCFA